MEEGLSDLFQSRHQLLWREVEDMGKFWPLDISGGIKNYAVALHTVSWFLRRQSIELQCDAANLLSDIFPKQLKGGDATDIHIVIMHYSKIYHYIKELRDKHKCSLNL